MQVTHNSQQPFYKQTFISIWITIYDISYAKLYLFILSNAKTNFKDFDIEKVLCTHYKTNVFYYLVHQKLSFLGSSDQLEFSVLEDYKRYVT